jgi:hemerythrin-like metal-binding protein
VKRRNPVFEWKDSYSVKVEMFDTQHKQLFAILGELHEAMKSGHGKDVAGGVLKRLIDYTVNHFNAEENLMEKHEFPGLAAHRVKHQELTKQVVAFQQEFDSGVGNITPQLMTFLQDWLTNHIQSTDQGYSKFLNAHGVR